MYCIKLRKIIKHRCLYINQLREEVQGEGIFIIDLELGSESYDLKKKKFNYVSVLANKMVKCWLYSQVDDVRGIRIIVMPTRP